MNTRSPTIKRLLRESRELSTSPSPDFSAAPLDTNLFEWHFTIRGPPSTPYALGLYHGRIVLPKTYPLRPPSFRFLTPSGRFEVNREICLSISGHHEESWQPAWGIRTALVAIRAFMEGDAKGQLGGVDASREVRERYARESAAWRCWTCGRTNEEIAKEMKEKSLEAEKGGRKLEDAEDVPEELRLGYRDEMEKQKEADQTSKNTSHATEANREGQARDLVPEQPAESRRDEPPSIAHPPQSPPIQPATLSPTSGPTIASSQAVRPTRTTQAVIRPARRREDDVILNRLDLAIAVFAVGLIFMILRKLASWSG
ncbi:MAG: hypothetical protein Q9159_001149 [Coniocarpon cinnabarinum]